MNLNRAKNMLTGTFGENHIIVASCMFNRALVHKSLGNYEQAI